MNKRLIGNGKNFLLRVTLKYVNKYFLIQVILLLKFILARSVSVKLYRMTQFMYCILYKREKSFREKGRRGKNNSLILFLNEEVIQDVRLYSLGYYKLID